MRYRFTGRPDGRFPDLVTGDAYEVRVITDIHGRPMIATPFYCLYGSWDAFYRHWQPIVEDRPNADEVSA